MTDEESLALHLPNERRMATGAFFTPRAIVERALEAVTPFLPDTGPGQVVDPACGAGAFLVAAHERWPRARLVGAELDPTSASLCRRRLDRAEVVVGDALATSGLDQALGDDAGFELWVGNPPFNGTSALLKDPAAWARACGWMPEGLRLKPGTSLREDYVFFLLKASTRLAQRPGALAFVTSATLLDTFSYAPVREALLRRLELRKVIELGPGAFRGTRVSTCITVWSTPGETRRHPSGSALFTPSAPTWALVPPRDEAAALDAAWKRQGAAALDALVPVSFPGLKTRFDELLVDDDAAQLAARMRGFFEATEAELPSFAERFGLSPALVDKLASVKRAAAGAVFAPGALRRFLRYRGPNPMGAPAFCYLDRRLIPRGDHRLRGAYDPHAHPVKLVFNRHELPLAAHVLETDGCVTAYRHSRFAPLEIPPRLLADPRARMTELEPALEPNLTPLGRRWAADLGSPLALFHHIATHVTGVPFQAVWAPAFGRSHAPLIAHPATAQM